MNIDPDQVLRELQDLKAALDALPSESPERAPLEERREVLREQARLPAEATRNLDALRAELEHLEGRLAAFDSEKIEVPNWQLAMTRGGKFSLVNPVADAARINDAIEAGQAVDRATIEARIARLRKALDL